MNAVRSRQADLRIQVLNAISGSCIVEEEEWRYRLAVDQQPWHPTSHFDFG